MRIEDIHQAFPRSESGRHINDICAMFDYDRADHPLALRYAETLSSYGLIEEVKPHTYRRARDEVVGTISLNARGFGFVEPELSDAPNLFIDPLDLGGARHRDRVSVKLYTAAEDGRYRGLVTRVLERGTQMCVGTFRLLEVAAPFGGASPKKAEAWLIPQSERLPSQIKISSAGLDLSALGEVEEGDLLATRLTDDPETGELLAIPLHKINPTDPQGQLEIVIYEQGLNLSLAPESREHAERFPDLPSEEEYQRRTDLRHLPFITIDPDTAKDFDDALYVQPLQREGESGWRLWVAIADVAHYVTAGDPIDVEAQLRSATLYLPAQAFPMLPHRLSNDLCSLKPHVDRLAMVACIEVSAQGDLGQLKVYEAVIHSQARLTYDEAASMIGALPERELPKHIVRQRTHVTAIRDCARALKNRRRRRGFLNLELIEPRINFDLRGMVGGFKVSPRHEAHEMVEESMLAANESIASLCIEEGLSALYRIHAPPPERGIDRFVVQSSLLGAPFEPKKQIKSNHLSRYLKRHEDHPVSELLSGLLLRAMSRAAYDPNPGLHFGLGTTTYLHFTSPIRRYPDLWVHRQLKRWLNDLEMDTRDDAREVAGYASRRERLVMSAERRVLDAYKALFMRDHIGETLGGVVCQTSPKGFMVNLKDYPVWCSHSAECLPGNFRYDEERFTWSDVVSRRRVTLGSQVEVRVLNSDVLEGKVEVILADL